MRETRELLNTPFPLPDDAARAASAVMMSGLFEINCQTVSLQLLEQCEAAALVDEKLKAHSLLGYCKLNGICFDKNAEAGFALTKNVAEAEHETAIFNLGVCYARGTVVKVNFREAFRWYRKAAEAGETVAMLNLGACYQGGTGVEADSEEEARS
ncbi:tetratricopeptide repeat protein [Stappia sp.]|uniref:tetratricopeptide repeat protein n=1 Tax=Stappia sp. TaxID=1870903 RepID=UPI003A9A5F88